MTLEDIQKIVQQSNAAQSPDKTTAAQDLQAFSGNYTPVRFGPSNTAATPAPSPATQPTTGNAPAPTNTPTSGGGTINVPVIPVEGHTPVARVDPTTYEWTGDREKDGEVIEKLRKRYGWEEPEQGTPGYSGLFRGTPGKPHGLGYRNDNPIDYSAQGAGFWSMGIDPNDPALGYHIAAFKKREAENWQWANGEYWANNKRTGNQLADDATVLDWYWRDLARRMDKSNSFFDSFIGKLFTNIAIGWATAGVGNMFGPWAARLFGAVMGGMRSDWDPLNTVMGGLSYDTGALLEQTGVTGIAKSVLPDWAEVIIPKSAEVTSIDAAGKAIIDPYTWTDALKSAGWTTAKEGLSGFQESLSQEQEQGQGAAEAAPLQPGVAPGLTPLPQGYVPPPITPIPPVMFGQEQGQGQTPANPFDTENNPFNPGTEVPDYAKGGPVRIEDLSNDDFINRAGYGGNDMQGSARRDLEALMAQIGQYAAGGMVPEYGYGGMVPEYGYGGMVPQYAAGGMVPEYAEGGEVEPVMEEVAQAAPTPRRRRRRRPAYLGKPVKNMPGFYNINPEKFDFYSMARHMDSPGIYTVGPAKLTMYETPEGSGYGVRARPGGRFVTRMPSDNSDAWNMILSHYNMSPYDPYHNTITAPIEGALPRTNLNSPSLAREEYNAAMRDVYSDLAQEGKPMIAYYDPRYSRPRGRKRTSPMLPSQDII